MNHNDSIIFRSGLSMGGIVLLALLGMLSSIWIAESSKGDAAAINLAGSLRMQSYRITTRLQQTDGANPSHSETVQREISEFERRLNQLWQTGAISPAVGDPRNQTLKTIETFWRDTLKPTLTTWATSNAWSAASLNQVDDFVAKLDAFVKLLERDTEAKILLLRLIQGIALFMILVLIFAAMHQLQTSVVTPLRELVELTRKARHGNLAVRASHVGNDELGELGHAFNLMAADLSTMYAELEARVEQQTQELRTSNRALELLYHTARRLSKAAPDEATYQTLLAEIEKLTGMGSVTLCLLHPNAPQASQRFSARPRALAAPPFCSRPNCNPCLGNGVTHPLDAHSEVFSIPVKDQNQQFGVLLVRNPGLDGAATWQLPLLEAVARHIAAALRANEQTEHRRRLELLEERSAIARELHDSLAQSLSYLKIQLSRLQMLQGNADTGAAINPDIHAITMELREGLTSAYRQLRELITTFRLKMEHPRLEHNLRDAVEEFTRRSGLPITLDSAGWHCVLNPNEQIHVMQIVREALNNAVKHARARQITVRLRRAATGEATIDITDDGVGLPPDPHRENHFGLNIMRERAHNLGGALHLRTPPPGGLHVQLRFMPAAYRNHAAELEPEIRHAG